MKTGAVLVEAAAIVARHWLIVVVSLVAMAEFCLLVFYFVGQCFLSPETACVSVDVYFLLGDAPGQVQYHAALYGDYLAGYIVLATAQYFLFSSRRLALAAGESHRLNSLVRTVGFFARAALYWILLIGSNEIVQAVFAVLGRALVAPLMPSAVRFGLYFADVLASIVVSSYLRAGLALYLVSAALSSEPLVLLSCWRAVRGIRWRLFASFFLIDFVLNAAQLAMIFLPAGSWATPLQEETRHLTGLSQAYLRYTLPFTVGYVFASVLGTMLAAAVSFIAFRALTLSESQRTVRVFD